MTETWTGPRARNTSSDTSAPWRLTFRSAAEPPTCRLRKMTSSRNCGRGGIAKENLVAGRTELDPQERLDQREHRCARPRLRRAGDRVECGAAPALALK